MKSEKYIASTIPRASATAGRARERGGAENRQWPPGPTASLALSDAEREGRERDRDIDPGPKLTSTGIRYSLFGMRTTLDLPDELLQEAQRLLGFKSKTDVVVLSLRELIRRRRLEGLKELLGQVTLDIDVPRSRRRPRRRT